MTDRVLYLTVALEEPTRDDDASTIAKAIGMIKGVRSVKLGEAVTGNEYFMRELARIEILTEVSEMVRKKV